MNELITGLPLRTDRDWGLPGISMRRQREGGQGMEARLVDQTEGRATGGTRQGGAVGQSPGTSLPEWSPQSASLLSRPGAGAPSSAPPLSHL